MGIGGVVQEVSASRQDLLHGDVQHLEKRAGILAGFVDTTLSGTPRQSISAICAFATPTAALGADQPTSLSVPLALPVLALLAPYPLAHTSCTTSTSLAWL